MNELKTFKNYINGQWLDASTLATFEQRNPSMLYEVTGLFPLSSKEDTILAIEAAQSAFTEWKTLSPFVRLNISKVLALMIERREDIAGIITWKTGK